MKLVDMSVKEFINTLASDAVAPGGGSVSALAGANGSGLMAMAGELSYHKKAFKALDEETKKHFKDTIEFFIKSKDTFMKLIDDDTDAFNGLMDAFRMPKASDEEKNLRKEAIQKATLETIRVPLEVCQLAIENMRQIKGVMEYANKNTISDQGVGVMMLHTAIHGSAMNVLINLSGLKDQEKADDFRHTVEEIKAESDSLRVSLLENVNL
jgi:formiminotetrahydrofolate cyclodeaminase